VKPRKFLKMLGGIAMAALSMANAYGFESDDLDINMNPIYLSTRAHKDANVQSELVFHIPIQVTKSSRETGLGLVSSLVYFDNKPLMHIRSESATVRGAGRLYYFASAYNTVNTFVPYVTLYRDFLIGYRAGVKGASTESKTKSWLPVGFLYAHRMNDRVVLHTDAEIYSYAKPRNHTYRLGASYEFSQQFLLSASYERLSWDMRDDLISGLSMKGKSDNLYLKLMSSKPLKDNFTFLLGIASNANTPGPALTGQSLSKTQGVFFGVEASLGTLVW